jgi:hypothetical protein
LRRSVAWLPNEQMQDEDQKDVMDVDRYMKRKEHD